GAHEARQLLIERRETSLAVHDENEQRRLFDGNLRLAKDFLRDQSLFVGNDPAGVDHFQRLAAPLRFAVDAVARDTGFARDDGAARAGQAIEERGLAHVGAPDNDQGWQSRSHEFQLQLNLQNVPHPGIGRMVNGGAGLQPGLYQCKSQAGIGLAAEELAVACSAVEFSGVNYGEVLAGDSYGERLDIVDY